MGIIKKIFSALFGSSGAGYRDDGIYFYVKCGKCGTPVKIRVDRHHDLLRDFDSGEYTLQKEIMDNSCFSLMHASIRFNEAKNIIDKSIEGGEFITFDEYQALTHPTEP